MKSTKMLIILVLGLAQVASASQSLTVNGEALEAITLKTGQACTVEVVSDNSNPYSVYVGFDDGLALGSFAHTEIRAEAGDLASVSAYSVPAFEGYFVTAAGSSPRPSAGVHFVFAYNPSTIGDTTLKVYDSTLTNVLDSVQITVLSSAMGTSITYQGRMIDNNDVADGLYDLRFELYDSPSDGNQIGSTVESNDLDIVDGYFAVELDFGPVYDGNAVWLAIEVRAGEVNDPNGYTMLSPRQQVTPTPYALYAKTAGNALKGSGTTNRISKFTGPSTLGDSALYEHNYYVGVGTTNPRGMFDVDCDGGDIYLDTFSSQIYIGDVEGDGDETLFTVDDSTGKFTFENGKVGIGTTSPLWELEVANQMPGNAAESAVTADDAGGAIAAYSSTFSTFPHLADRVSVFSSLATATGLDLRADGGTSDIRFYTGGITPSDERIRITSSGNVGIGTTNPGAKLEVKQNDWQDIVKVGTPDTSNRLILSSGPDYASVSGGQTNQNSIMISHSTGNVGIGPSLGLPQAKLQVNGDLKVKGDVTVDGAYVGSFPRPAYDTGWVPLLQGQDLLCIHNLGGNVDNYVVDLTFKSSYAGINNERIGSDSYHSVDEWKTVGARWRELTTSSIIVHRGEEDGYAPEVRVRIWVYK